MSIASDMVTDSGTFLDLCLSMIVVYTWLAPWKEASGFLSKSSEGSRINLIDVGRAVNTNMFELVGAADTRRDSDPGQFGKMFKLYILTDSMDPLQ